MPTHSPAPLAIPLASAPVAFTGAWMLLRAAASLPGLADEGGAPDAPLLAASAAAGIALLATAILLARRRAGGWVAAVALLFVLLGLAGASFILLRQMDWPGALAAAVALLVLVSAPVRQAYLG